MGGWHYPGTSVSVSLPLYPSLKDTEVKKVIGEVKEWREEVGLC
jgi:dTDP-4-amino-4,6-dideoxygalactose transaminase